MKEALSSFRKGWDIFRPFRKKFAILMIFMIANQLAWQVGPFIFGQLINSMQNRESIGRSMLLVIIAYATWLLAIHISTRRGLYQENEVEYDLEKYLGNMTLGSYLRLSLGQHRSQSSGITQSVVSKGRGSLEQMVFVLLYSVIPIVTQVIITIGALLWFEWRIGLLVIMGTLIFTYRSVRHNLKYYSKVRKFNRTGDKVNKHFGELLRNSSVVQLNAQEERVSHEYNERLEKWGVQGQEAWVPYIRGAEPQYLLLFTVRALTYALGVHLYYNEGLKVGDFVILVSWSNQATSDLWQIAPLQRQWLDLWAKVKRYFAVLDVVPKVQVVENPIPAENIEGKVEFRNVSYTYSDQRYVEEDNDDEDKKPSKPNLPALVDVNFTILPGQRVAFVGRSGAGKSTLLFLLTRGDDPNSGQILIDGNDLRLLHLGQYRKSIGLVEQNVLLFDNTIRYNMLFGLNGRAQGVLNEELERLADISRVNTFKDRLTDSWETRIGENGLQLSGGERQRVSIARALAKDSRLLLLDEATSNLDGENERHIKESIHNASEGRTTIIIAHRLSTVRDADVIYVMDKGTIVAQGRHEELVDISPIYRTLVHDQLVSL